MLDTDDKQKMVNYHVDSRFTRLTTPEGYDFAFIPSGGKPPTAWWGYDPRRRRHNIAFNVALDEMVNRPRAKKTLFLEKVYDHEGAHSLFTDRDQKKLDVLQKAKKLPWHIWNILEDARIEAKWRKKFGKRFGWNRFLKTADEEAAIPPEPDPLADPSEPPKEPEPINALRLFQDCIRMENSPKLMNEWVKKDKDDKVQFEGKGEAKYTRRHLIRHYYKWAAKMPTTTSLINIAESWLKTFPETGGCDGEGEAEGAGAAAAGGMHGGDMSDPGEGSGEMPTGAEDADGTEHKENEKTCEAMSGSGYVDGDFKASPKPSAEKDETYRYKGPERIGRIPSNHFFSDHSVRKIDYRRADSLIQLFEKFLMGGEAMVTTRNPSGKIDFRKFMRGAEDFYIRKGDDPLGVKKISFIMDCSGSMSRAINEGVYLAYVLNELVRRRRIDCDKMILTGGNYHDVKMPFPPELLEYVLTPGSIEGFAPTMRAHEQELIASDLTICFTDGNIVDEHIRKEEWHRKGVYTVGLFSGDPDRSETLHQWFDSVLVRNDVEAIADSLVQIIKR